MPEKYSKIVRWLELPYWLYDILIVVGIVVFTGAGLIAIELQTPFMYVFAGLFLLAALTIVYGSVIEPWILTVRHYDVGVGTREVTIAFISDIHVGPYKGERWVTRIVRKINGLSPDLVLIGGDLIHNNAKQASLLAPLAGLTPKIGSFAILGNHEWYYGAVESVERILTNAGIQVLRNRGVKIAEGLFVAGTDDDWYGETDFDSATGDTSVEDAVIMLIHNPEVASHAAGYNPALMLSGHNHGGQIRLPFLGSVSSMPNGLGRKYDRGSFQLDNGAQLIIGQGVGESGPRARLFCPPEIVLVKLRY